MMLGTRDWDSGCEPHYTIKNRLMVYWSSCGSDQAVCLEDPLVKDVLGSEKENKG